ncbi:putative prefoldin [Fagus crenata]
MASARASEMEKMSVEQLKAEKEQSDLEVNFLQDSLNNIHTAATHLELTSSTLHDLSFRPKGACLLVLSLLIRQRCEAGLIAARRHGLS